MIIGIWNQKNEGGIKEFNDLDGTVKNLDFALNPYAVSFMKLVNISGKKLIYAVDEKVIDEKGRVGGNILVYDFDEKSLIQIQETNVTLPCYLDVIEKYNILIGVNYGCGINDAEQTDSELAIYERNSSGLIKKKGTWRYENEFATTHFHSVIFVNTFDCIVVCDIGNGLLHVLRYENESIHHIYSVNAKKHGNIKPRYLVYDSKNHCVYVSDEKSWYTYIYKFQNGKLKYFSREHLLSEETDGEIASKQSDIWVSESFDKLYVCSRTGRFISTFSINEEGGLERIQTFYIDGAPRNIAIDHNNKKCYVSCTKDNKILVFNLDICGLFHELKETIKINAPAPILIYD